MRRLFASAASLTVLLSNVPALAGNVAKCEVVAMLTVEDESGGSASYRYYFPASDFLRGVYDPEVEVTREQDGHPIEGITCERQDLMPDEEDYAILATGIPMVLSQDFDRPDTDVLTLYFSEDSFKYRYLTEGEIDPGFESDLNALLEVFSGRDHGLVSKTEDKTDEPVDEGEAEIEEASEAAESVEDVEILEDIVAEEPLEDTADKPTKTDIAIVENEVETEPQAEEIIAANVETQPIDTDDPESVSSVTDLVFDPETGELVPASQE